MGEAGHRDWQLLAVLLVLYVSSMSAATACPLREILQCNEDLEAQLDTINALAMTANAQKCSLLFRVRTTSGLCMALNMSACDSEMMTVTDSWTELNAMPELNICEDIVCTNRNMNPVVLDGCIETLENSFESFTSLCSSSDREAVVATSRACVVNALSTCAAFIQDFWQRQIDNFAAEMTSSLTAVTCSADELCSDVPSILDEIQACYDTYAVPMGTIPIDEFCSTTTQHVTCLTAATLNCASLTEMYVGEDSIMMERLTTIGCIGHQADEDCRYTEWSGCYSPIRVSLGTDYYNYQTNVLELFRADTIDWAVLCSTDVAAADEVVLCAREEAGLCRDHVDWRSLGIHGDGSSGKLQALLHLDSLHSDFLSFVMSNYCGNGDCDDLDQRLSAMADCTAEANLQELSQDILAGTGSCSPLQTLLNCALDQVSSCPLLKQSLYAQLDVIPGVRQAMGLCKRTADLQDMECTHELYRVQMIHERCLQSSITTCEELQGHITCIMEWASGCDRLLHIYLDEQLLDLAIYSDNIDGGCGTLIVEQQPLVTRDCYNPDCYGDIIQALATFPGTSNLPPNFAQAMQLLDQSSIQCNDLTLLTNGLACESSWSGDCAVGRLSMSVDVPSTPKVFDVDKIQMSAEILCTEQEGTCPSGQATMADLSRCLEPLPHLRLISSTVRHQQLTPGTTDDGDTCSDLSRWAACYDTASASCSFINNAIINPMLDDRDRQALKICKITLDLGETPTTVVQTTTTERYRTVTVNAASSLEHWPQAIILTAMLLHFIQ